MSSPTNTDLAVTDDVFLAEAEAGALHMLQPLEGLRSGLDAVVLAAAAPAGVETRVLDAGAGVGVVGLAVARRCAGSRVTLIERETELAGLARDNAVRNGLEARVSIVCADLTAPLMSLQGVGLMPETFDQVLANPPFHEAGDVRASPRAFKARASTFEAGDLDRWLRFLTAMTRPGGTMTLIHRADALAALLIGIGTRFGDLKVFPLFPREGAAAIRVVVQGIKGSRAPLRLLPGLVLHGLGGEFTPAAEEILRKGLALEIHGGPPA